MFLHCHLEAESMILNPSKQGTKLNECESYLLALESAFFGGGRLFQLYLLHSLRFSLSLYLNSKLSFQQ